MHVAFQVPYTKDAELSRAARFLQGVARLTNRAFDDVLGRRLWSLQAVGVSFWFSLASINLAILVMAYVPRFAPQVPILHLVLFVVTFIGLGILPILVDRLLWAFLIWTAVAAMFLLRLSGLVLFAVHTYGYTPPLRVLGIVLLLLVLSFGFDVLYISATRMMLRWIFQMRRVHEIIGVIALNVALALALVYGPIELMTVLTKPYLLGAWGAWSVTLVAFNFGDLIACSVFFVVMLAVLAHRLMWGILERHIYALQRFGLIRRKWLLLTIASALWFGPKGVEFLKFAMQFFH